MENGKTLYLRNDLYEKTVNLSHYKLLVYFIKEQELL